MNRVSTMALGTFAALLLVATAQAGIALNAARIGAADVAALAKFYESAFGLQEVRRFEFPGMLEILLNFGDTAAAAKANQSPQIVIMHRDSDATKDPMPHLIFNVTDIGATVALPAVRMRTRRTSRAQPRPPPLCVRR